MSVSILIVDDSPEDREVLRRTLAEFPGEEIATYEASDEASCLMRLHELRHINCVLLDYSLPGRDGLKALSGIFSINPDLAVVMITGYGSEHIAVEAMKLGAQDYLSKSMITADNLQRAIVNATERTEMRRKIREQQESLQSFAHVLVHDLRSPLRSIRTAIDGLIEDLPGEVLTDNSEILDFVLDGAERVDSLIVALEGYTQVDGEQNRFAVVDLNLQVDAVRANLMVDLKAQNARLVSSGELPTIYCSAPQIGQLIQNIVSNGIKYNRSEVPEVRISARQTETHWLIEFSDNGIGIEANSLNRIFDPFHRLHRDQEFDGTGLGLATCKKIAERHNGSLYCRSEVGVGSVFTLALPALPE